MALFHLNHIEEAADAFRRAADLKPDYANDLCNLGSALHRLAKYGEAADAYRKALAANPDYPLAQTGLAAAFQENRKRGVTLAKINISLGANRKPTVTTVQSQGTFAERRRQEAQDVIDTFRNAAEQAPNDGLAAAQLYFELRHTCDWDGLDETEERLDALTRDAIERGIAPGEHAFIHIARIEDVSANLQVARLHADGISRKLTRRGAIPYSHGSEPAPKRRMRLGYLSADFRDHAISHLIAGLFAHHDRAGFEVIAYSHGDDDDSTFRQRILDTVDRFVDLRDLSDEAAAEKFTRMTLIS